MTQEEKDLLLKDLSARLPYGVYAETINELGETHINKICTENINLVSSRWFKECKPYLRPMTSMTEEEKKELKKLFDAEEVTSDSICFFEGGTLEEYVSQVGYSFCAELIDWLNERHFDYRGLIEKGLAIAITEENNPYKEK